MCAAAEIWVLIYCAGDVAVGIEAVFHERLDAGAESEAYFVAIAEVAIFGVDPGLEDVPGYFKVNEILDGGAELPESIGVEEEGFGEFGWGCELEELVGYSA